MTAATATKPGNPLRIAVWSLVIALWLLPLIAKLFTAEVNWSVFDHLLWAVLLAVPAGLYELATRMSRNRAYRAGFALAVATGFFICWSNLAVGIVGNEDNAINLIFYGVLALGVIGALVARFEAAGMARVLTIVAVAQGATAILALVEDGGRVFLILSLFVAMWLTSAELFRKAAREKGV